MFPVAAVVQVEQATERPVESALIQIFLVQLLCMAAVALELMEAVELPLQVAEVMVIHQQQTEVVGDHNQPQILGLRLQVVLEL
jgi:hypothetical protein